MGIFDGYNFDPQNYGGGGILSQLLAGLNLPQQTPSGGFAPIQPPTDVSAVNRNGTPGVTLPQQADSGFGQQGGGGNPLTGLFSGLGNGLGSLFGGGGPQAPSGPQMPQQAPQMPQQATQMAQQATQQQAPGLMDRLGAGWMGLGHGGLTSAIGGLVTGQRQDPQGLLERALVQRGVSPDMARAGIQNPQLLPTLLAEQGQGATYQALVQAGLPSGIAQAAALNPEVLKTIAPQLYSKPTLQETSANPLTGQKSFAWVNPDKQSVAPAIVNGVPISGSQRPGSSDVLTGANAAAVGLPNMGNNDLEQIDALTKSGIQGDEFYNRLKSISPAFADKVKGMANADIAYPSGFIMKTPYGAMLTDAISALKPGVTAQDYATKQKARNYWTSGPGAAEIKAINTAIYHADKLQQASDRMGGFDTLPALMNPIWQGAKNQMPALGPGFQDAKKDWDTTAETLATEVSKALNGGTPHVADKEHWRSILDGADGPEQRRAAIRSVMNILEGRTQAQAENYTQALGSARDPISFIDPKNREIFDRLRSKRSVPAPAQQQQQAIPRVTSAADYANIPKGAQYTDPDGHVRTKQ